MRIPRKDTNICIDLFIVDHRSHIDTVCPRYLTAILQKLVEDISQWSAEYGLSFVGQMSDQISVVVFVVHGAYRVTLDHGKH